MKPKMTQSDFWNLPIVKKQQEIQKTHPFGSNPHKMAFYAIKGHLAKMMGKEFAEQYMGEYE